MVDPARHDIADQDVILKVLRPCRIMNVHRRADRGASVRVLDRHRSESQAVVRFSEARIKCTAQELIDRRRVTVRGVQISARIPRESEWIYLSPRVPLDARSIDSETECVPAVHIERRSIARREMGSVVES